MIAAMSAQSISTQDLSLQLQQREEQLIAKSLLLSLFQQHPQIDYYLWIVPQNFSLSDHLQQLFTNLILDDETVAQSINNHSPTPFDDGADAKEIMTTHKHHPLIVLQHCLKHLKIVFIHRSQFLPKLKIRFATMEDNDDILPIIASNIPEILAEQSNPYFFAELIEEMNNENHLLVGLKDEIQPVAVLATGSDINTSLLTRVYDLEAYPDLIRAPEIIASKPPAKVAIVGDIRLLDVGTLSGFCREHGFLFVNLESDHVDWRHYLGGAVFPTTVSSEVEHLLSSARYSVSNNSTTSNTSSNTTTVPNNNGVLMNYLQSLVYQYLLGSDTDTSSVEVPTLPLPPLIVVYGLVASEEEANKFYSTIFHEFDSIIECVSTSEEVEEDEDDEYLQHHLDALEILREYYFTEENTLSTYHHNNNNHHHQNIQKVKRSSWQKYPIDKETIHTMKIEHIHKLFSYYCSELLIQRETDLHNLQLLSSEQPPLCNGFAITLCCIHDDYYSRVIDLLKYAFEIYETVDYCVYLISNEETGRRVHEFIPRFFNYIPMKSGVSFDQSLFLMHRSYFYGLEHLTVSRGFPGLVPGTPTIPEIVDQMIPVSSSNNNNNNSNPGFAQEKDDLVTGLTRCIDDFDIELGDNPGNVVLYISLGDIVPTHSRVEPEIAADEKDDKESNVDRPTHHSNHSNNNHLIGILLLTRRHFTTEDAQWYRLHYHLDELVHPTRHRVKHVYLISGLYVDPVFSRFTRLIMQHAMRICNKTVFLYHAPRIRDGLIPTSNNPGPPPGAHPELFPTSTNTHNHNNSKAGVGPGNGTGVGTGLGIIPYYRMIPAPKEIIEEFVLVKPREVMQQPPSNNNNNNNNHRGKPGNKSDLYRERPAIRVILDKFHEEEAEEHQQYLANERDAHRVKLGSGSGTPDSRPGSTSGSRPLSHHHHPTTTKDAKEERDSVIGSGSSSGTTSGVHHRLSKLHTTALQQAKQRQYQRRLAYQQEINRIPQADSPLYLLSKHLLALPRHLVATRVVIVGGSMQSYALLETLTTDMHMTTYYPNLYFVLGILPGPLRDRPGIYPTSLPSSTNTPNNNNNNNNNILYQQCEDNLSGCLSLQKGEYPSLTRLTALDLVHRMNLIQGHLTDIDRDHKAVILSDALVLEYDYLIISTCTVGK
jgi:hypothetical protein